MGADRSPEPAMGADRSPEPAIGADRSPPPGGRIPGIDPPMQVDEQMPVFVISVAAQLAGMHPQTLRQYDRLGLVSPGRASGRGRRYSARDVATLREVQRLSQDEGVNLAGIKRILELEAEVAQLRERLRRTLDELDEAQQRLAGPRRVFAADPFGGIIAVPVGRSPQRATGPSTALVVWRPSRR